MFLHAYTLVAMDNEPDSGRLIDAMETHAGAFYYTPLVVFETVIALARKKKIAMLGEAGCNPTPHAAGHRNPCERLSCCAGRHRNPARNRHAAAKALNAPLLFVGEDFARTDIAPA